VTDLPAPNPGFRASGKIGSDAALDRGEKPNIYFELADDFHGLDWALSCRT
jgi:hypothetical protein